MKGVGVYRDNEKRREYERKRKKGDPEYVAHKKEYMRQWAERNRAKTRAQNKKKWRKQKNRPRTAEQKAKDKAKLHRYYMRNREQRQKDALEYYYKNRDVQGPENKIRARVWRRLNRGHVLDHYGRACTCCGSERQLTMDHIFPYDEASGSPRGGTALDSWLVKNNFPTGFQTLCKGCNWSKGKGSHCRMHFSILKL